MIKSKLKELREKKFSQEEFAHLLDIETSNYNRRENGITKISKREWDKMAKLLNCTLQKIYEPEDGVYIVNVENASGNYSGSHSNFKNNSNFVLETMQKYIVTLEIENATLKSKITILEERVSR